MKRFKMTVEVLIEVEIKVEVDVGAEEYDMKIVKLPSEKTVEQAIWDQCSGSIDDRIEEVLS